MQCTAWLHTDTAAPVKQAGRPVVQCTHPRMCTHTPRSTMGATITCSNACMYCLSLYLVCQHPKTAASCRLLLQGLSPLWALSHFGLLALCAMVGLAGMIVALVRFGNTICGLVMSTHQVLGLMSVGESSSGRSAAGPGSRGRPFTACTACAAASTAARIAFYTQHAASTAAALRARTSLCCMRPRQGGVPARTVTELLRSCFSPDCCPPLQACQLCS